MVELGGLLHGLNMLENTKLLRQEVLLAYTFLSAHILLSNLSHKALVFLMSDLKVHRIK